MNLATIVHIIEILLSVIGIVLIFMQSPGDFANSFSASSLEAFRLQSTRDKLLFFGTIVVIIALIVVVVIDLKFVTG